MARIRILGVYSGILTACLLLGAFLGCFGGVECGTRYGRPISFRITGLNAMVMSILLAFVPGYWLIVLVRTLLGVSVGFATALCPW
jgi:MFS family permease